jgi:uncharacterized protein DUF3300
MVRKTAAGQADLTSLLPLAVLFTMWSPELLANQGAQAPESAPMSPPPHAPQTPEQLQQLVAPIALYPDSLVAQILAASTFPEQVVEAERWLQAHPDLQGTALGQALDQQPWDPSVKAIAAVPSVLGNMDKNLTWTSALGDAYYNQQQDVMNAIQVMRQRAQAAGNLQTTPQQTVETQDASIVIQPASPDVVYVPAYDPWLIYGYPIVAWPGWYPYPGIWFGGPYLSFGVGFGIGFFAPFGWGWGHWGFDWYHRYPVYGHGRYYSRSNTFYNRNSYYRGGGQRGVATNVERGVGANRPGGERPGGERPGGERPGGERPGGERPGGERPGGATGGRSTGVYNSPGATTRPFSGDTQAARGYAQPRGESGIHSGAFSNYDHGGEARSFSSRGSASVGGGHAGGGAHGGGSHR